MADAEIDDVAAFMGKRGRPCQHGKGIFLAEAIEGGNGVEHFVCPDWR
jgi:hypothetical protein